MSENSQAKKREIGQYNTAKLTLDIAMPLHRDTCIRTARKQGCEYSEQLLGGTLERRKKKQVTLLGFFSLHFHCPRR